MAKMSLHEKATLGKIAAMSMKHIANRLEYDMKDYDCHWPETYIKELRSSAEYILKNYK